MEASSSQPIGSGADRPINPATQRPVREHAAGGDEKDNGRAPEGFDVGDLRRWEDARLSEFDEKLANLAAVSEGQQEELRGILRNELMIALVTLGVAGFLAVLAKEVSKMKEASRAVDED